MQIVKMANLLIRFLLELCILAILGYWGAHTGKQTILKFGLGIGSPLLFAIVWGIFLAPASSKRLQEPWLLIVEVVLFILAGVALYSTGQRFLAGAFGILYLINKMLIIFWKQ